MAQSLNHQSEIHEFVVPPEAAGTRLDLFLAERLPGWSRSQIQRLIRQGRVVVNSPAALRQAHGSTSLTVPEQSRTAVGSRLPRKAGEALEARERIVVRPAVEPSGAVAEDLPLKIVYEDDDLIVVNKPAGMVVHVGAGVKSGTLVNALLHYTRALSSLGGGARPGIVHRLDRMTSGLVVVAKNEAAHRSLAEQFKSHTVCKKYTVLVHGVVRETAGEVHKPVGRDPRRRTRMKAGGLRPRDALTRYRVLRRFERFTLLEAEPKTGRTHQLRVHCAALGHPVVGDTLYGAPGEIKLSGKGETTLARNFLHATSIEFRHPRTGETLCLRAPLPLELENFLLRLDAAP